MLFSEAVFLFAFLPIALMVYYSPICKSIKRKNRWLLFISVGFYAWGEPFYVVLMLLSILVNGLFGRWVSGHAQTAKGRRIVVAACIYNLGILFLFKYMAWLLGEFGLLLEESRLGELVLPIGISFYTFQALSYVIDVYRGKEQAQKNILDVGLYIAFFPQLIAGPIVRYGTVSAQIKERKHSFGLFSDGAYRFVMGLSKKVLLANHLAVIARISFERGAGERAVALAWMGALAFMLQIYYDFSGYSDMAVGLGKMFGFEFPENFNYPYIARSVTEFWRRWHISLGTWFRDYVYIPLGGSRASPGKHIRNIVTVWLLTGIWHGANWTFVVWGMISCIFILWEKYRKPLKNRKVADITGFIGTFIIVLFSWVVFNAESLTYAISYYASMFHLSGNAWTDAYGQYWIGQYKMFLLVGLLFSFPVLEKAGKAMDEIRAGWIWEKLQSVAMGLLLVLDICFAVDGGYNPFIYFNF